MANGDEIWVGTMRGAARYSNGLWSQFIPGSGASRGIYGIAADPGGGLWFSSVGMWFRNSAGTFPWQWQTIMDPTALIVGENGFRSSWNNVGSKPMG